MKETSPPRTWLHRLLPCFGSHQDLEDVTEEKIVVPPVSASAMASAESALRWVSKVPGARRAEVKIGSALEMIKGLNVASPHDTETLKSLEHHVWYLAELLDPFATMPRDQISPVLQYEVLMLGRELQIVSSPLKQRVASGGIPRPWSPLHIPKQREQPPNSAQDIRTFTRDLKLALDRFRDNALPSYPVSPIEAALIPLGMISNSSCTLSPLIEWMIQSEKTIDDRIGAVRHIELYSRTNFRRPTDFTFLVVGLENGRTIWNWLKIEMDDTDTRGIVTFWNTRDGLHEGLQSGAKAHIEEDTLLVSDFAKRFKDICVHPPNQFLVVLSAFFRSLASIGFVMYDEEMIAGGRRRSRVYT